MSRSVDLFVDSALPIDALAGRIGELGGHKLTVNPEGTWVLRDGDVTAELVEHRYADDGDLWLTRYRYALSARVASGASPKDSPEAAVLRRLAQVLHQSAVMPVLLVLDLQYRDTPAPLS